MSRFISEFFGRLADLHGLMKKSGFYYVKASRKFSTGKKEQELQNHLPSFQ